MTWHALIQGVRYGPVEEAVVRQWIAEGRLTANDLVWNDGMTTWLPAGTALPDAFAAVAPPPPAPPPLLAAQPKSRLAAGLLGILIGGLGIHNFYLGYTGKGMAQLLITVLSCGFGAFISGIWGLIEGIMILTGSINQDAQGRPLGQ